MDKTKWPAISALVTGTVLLTRSVPTTFAFDKPVHSSIIILASCAVAIIGLSRYLPKDGARSHKGQQYEALPLGEIGQPHSSREPSPSPEDVRYPSSLRKLRIIFMALVFAICVRVEVLRRILANTQCAGRSWEPLLPLALALWDYIIVQRHKRRKTSDDPDSSVYDELEDTTLKSPYRYMFAAGILSIGSALALATTSSPASTYICAASLHNSLFVPNSQRAATILDFLIVCCIGQLLHQQDGKSTRSVSLRFISVGWAALFSAAILVVSGILYYIFAEDERKWVLAVPRLYFWSILRLDALICLIAICTLLTVSAFHATVQWSLVLISSRR